MTTPNYVYGNESALLRFLLPCTPSLFTWFQIKGIEGILKIVLTLWKRFHIFSDCDNNL